MIFARRLSKFPEAWTLPFYPFIIRGIVALIETMRSERTRPSIQEFIQQSATFRRLCLFMGLLLVRLLILYSFFNFVEEKVVSGEETINEGFCWYSEFLRKGQAQCSGRVFDFSDHVVLYFAHILPVMLAEGIYSFAVPFWGEGRKRNRVFPVLMVMGILYMYFICLLGAYKTSAYFHTPAEVFFGYGVSLLIQIPLCLIQCHSKWIKARRFVFGNPPNSSTTIPRSTSFGLLISTSSSNYKQHESDASF